jgi:hypothetical protein
MTLELVLSIIDTELKIVLQMLAGLTDEQKHALWARHEARQARWDRLLDSLLPAAKLAGEAAPTGLAPRPGSVAALVDASR